MLLKFFQSVRQAGIPASVRELLDLIAALEQHLAFADLQAFYFLSRSLLVKDERLFDRFDRAFARCFEGLDSLDLQTLLEHKIPEEWLRHDLGRSLSAEQKARIEQLGGLDQLLDTLSQRLQEQKERHAGGNKWIGTGGTSPFGSGGYHPAGVRIGQAGPRQGRAVKVWERREFRDLDSQTALGNRNLQLALRRLRRFARAGAAEELDLEATIAGTAREGGLLDIRLRPERRNTIRLLLLFDIGGSMDAHVRTCEELFSACRSEFQHLEYYYFHNFIYESVWRHSQRRHEQRIATLELLRTYGPEWKVLFVGDAAMSPYEISHPGGSVEHWNEEAGAVWMQRFTRHFSQLAWINPLPGNRWLHSPSTAMTRQLLEDRMYPMTLSGLEDCMRQLAR